MAHHALTSVLQCKTLTSSQGEIVTFLTAGGAIFGPMASKTLQVQSTFEARFINMINEVVRRVIASCDGKGFCIFVAS